MNIKVAYPITENYFYMAMVSIHSLMVNNQEHEIDLTLLLDETINEECRKKFEYIKNYKNCNSIKTFDVDKSLYSKYNNDFGTLYAFELANILNCHKVLFVHPSCIINDDVSEVFQLELQNNSVAAAKHIQELDNTIIHKSAFRFANYLMLLNLDLFRERNYYKILMFQRYP